MKRKKAKRKTARKPAAIPAKPLHDMGGMPAGIVDGGLSPSDVNELLYGGESVNGIELPPDFDTVACFIGLQHVARTQDVPRYYPWIADKYPDPVEAKYNAEISAVMWAVRSGFCLALKLYADDMKESAKFGPILERLRKGPRNGGAATKRKAEPRRQAIRRRYSELRKEGFEIGEARRKIEDEYAMRPADKISYRQIERHTEGMP